jgi:HSP20 family protein
MRRMMDRLMDSAVTGDSDTTQAAVWGLALDVAEKDDEFVVKASIPGIDPDELEITYTNDTLSIKGEIKEEKDTEESNYHLRERRYGAFHRSVLLPSLIDSNKIEASYDKGVLMLRLPKAEEVKPKRIPIKVGQKVIEGKTK